MNSTSKKRIIVVLGMHRSGTSAITRAVVATGAAVGENLLAPAQDNPRGYWEDRDFVNFNERLLGVLGASYDSLFLLPEGFEQDSQIQALELEAVVMLRSKLEQADLFAIKDPRTCRLLPFWQRVFEHLQVDVDYVIVVRNPLSVAQSLKRRDGFVERKSYWLWLQHCIGAASATEGRKRVFVEYDRLMADPEQELGRLCAALGLMQNRAAVAEYIDNFLSPELRHTRFEAGDLVIAPLVPEEVRLAYGVLSQACGRQVPDDLGALPGSWTELARRLAAQRPLLDFVHEYDQLNGRLQVESAALTRHVQSLDSQLNAAHERLTRVDAELEAVQRARESCAEELEQLRAEHTDTHERLQALLNSRSMRVTAPLRWGSGVLQKLCGSGVRVLRQLLRDPRSVTRAAAHIRAHGLRSGLQRLREVARPAAPLSAPAGVRFALQRGAVVLTTPHCLFVAELIVRQLQRAGIRAQIIFERPAAGFAPLPHFVICPQMFAQLPELYVAFQMEQTVSSRWLTESYLNQLNHAFAVFDYSQVNLGYFTSNGLSYRQMYLMPVGFHPEYAARYGGGAAADKEYDVLFYGDANNQRRREFIARIEQKYRVKVISNLFGEELYAELRKARVVVNIHYYEGALLETTRIHEALSLDCLIVSESSTDIAEHQGLHDVVDFVDIGDVDAMLARLDHWLADEQRRADKVRCNRQLLESQPDWFAFYFQRFLLASDNIDFDTFYRLAGDNIRFQGDFVCLGLPESVERRASFNADNHYGIEYFPGLRHELGWIGCGMSYKFIMRKAKEQGLAHISVCEDDVEFLDGWQDRYRTVLAHLSSNTGDWDVFSGFIADLHGDTRVLGVTELEGLELVHIDHMVSAVLNIYNTAFYDDILRWDETDHDVASNAIDRYMENIDGIRVLTVHPFLVGHKEEQHSTLWGFQNTRYNKLIEESTRKLEAKVADYRASKAS